jgi:hypothetical protein
MSKTIVLAGVAVLALSMLGCANSPRFGEQDAILAAMSHAAGIMERDGDGRIPLITRLAMYNWKAKTVGPDDDFLWFVTANPPSSFKEEDRRDNLLKLASQSCTRFVEPQRASLVCANLQYAREISLVSHLFPYYFLLDNSGYVIDVDPPYEPEDLAG